jgi:haloalkane dehalogenase
MSDFKYINVNGHKIHYIEEGQGDPILFLHGIPTSSYLWRNIIPILSKKALCIAPDLIGMGKSDKPKSQYNIMNQLHDIETFIKKLKLTNLTLVLHEFGSIVGFYYAMNNPNNVKGLVFYEPYLHPISNLDQRSLPIQELIHSFYQESDRGYKKIVNDNFLINNLLPGMAFGKLSNTEKKHYQKPFLSLEARNILWDHFKELYLNDDSESTLNKYIVKYAEFLQQSPIPKLLLYNNPGFNTSMTTVKWCQDNLPNIKLADLEEGLHLAQETNPQLFGAVLLDWFNTLA